MKLSILYRGPLASCNYGCSYCPFAKRTDTREQLANDRESLARFAEWLADQSSHELSLFFTPWGEALVRRWYQTAIARLSHLDHIAKVVIQTNLAWPIGWLDDCVPDRVAFWGTYHPTEISLSRFVRKVLAVRERGFRLSVGVVGVIEHLPQIRELRQLLPDDIYLWINAERGRRRSYSLSEQQSLTDIDPLFPINATRHQSRGQACRTGENSFTVDGNGDMHRCHFVAEHIGNIYRPDWEVALHARPCTRATCDCHIGYAHLEHLQLDKVFGSGILERIPSSHSR